MDVAAAKSSGILSIISQAQKRTILVSGILVEVEVHHTKVLVD